MSDYDFKSDAMGNIIITRLRDGKTVFLQGDDAEQFGTNVSSLSSPGISFNQFITTFEYDTMFEDQQNE